MRAITDWYFTAHPPIMHDLHEAQPLMYTYSGGPPQNPNLDPILFAELPFFSNWELAQMTKWGMPGVYTYAFMDGWSPGYLGSVAYNHNGMMRMYETQSGREGGPGAAATTVAAARSCRSRAVRAADSAAAGGGSRGRGRWWSWRRWSGRPWRSRRRCALRARLARSPAGALAPPARSVAGVRPTVPTGRGGGQPREWYRGIPIPPNAIAELHAPRQHELHGDRRAVGACSSRRCSRTRAARTSTSRRATRSRPGARRRRIGYVFPVQRDMTKVATLVNILRAQGIEVGTAQRATSSSATDTFPAGSYLIKLNQPYGRLAKNLLEKQDYPDPALTTYDDSGWSMGFAFNVDVKEIKDKSDPRGAGDAGQDRGGESARSRAAARPGSPSRTTDRTT